MNKYNIATINGIKEVIGLVFEINDYKVIVHDSINNNNITISENIADVRLSFAEIKDAILKFKAKSEYQQAAIIILRKIFKANEA